MWATSSRTGEGSWNRGHRRGSQADLSHKSNGYNEGQPSARSFACGNSKMCSMMLQDEAYSMHAQSHMCAHVPTHARAGIRRASWRHLEVLLSCSTIQLLAAASPALNRSWPSTMGYVRSHLLVL
eukprot:1141841-Pelagomonas_calceolata.AAC.3